MTNDSRKRAQAMFNNLTGMGAFVVADQTTMADQYQQAMYNDLVYRSDTSSGGGTATTPNQQLTDKVLLVDGATKVYEIRTDEAVLQTLNNLTQPVAVSPVQNPVTTPVKTDTPAPAPTPGTTGGTKPSVLSQIFGGGGGGGTKPSVSTTPAPDASQTPNFWQKNKKALTIAGIALAAIALVVAVVLFLRG